MKNATIMICLCGGLLFHWPGHLSASGSYRSKAPGGAARKIDSQKYDFGKKIFNREMKLGPTVEETFHEQDKLLMSWQKQLPLVTRRRTKLSEFAGRLNAPQLDALKYYLSIRYRIR